MTHVTKLCDFMGCEHSVHRAKYCRNHQQQLRTTGVLKPLRKAPVVNKDRQPCAFEGCVRSSHAFGLCAAHYSQKWRGQELKPLRVNNVGRMCDFEECGRPATCRGYCASHYNQYRTGKELQPVGVPRPLWTAERILEESTPDGDCLLFGTSQVNRYPQVRVDNANATAHRVVFRSMNPDAPKGAPVHHKCGNSYCVKPDHLQLASCAENTLEMLGRRAYEAEISHLKARIAELETLI